MTALDLFCGSGGACLGLQAAGFEVVGIDRNPRCGRYYPGAFVHADALHPPVDLGSFDLVWASPPCQKFSYGTHRKNKGNHPNLIPATRALLADHPFTVIENVPSAPIRADLALNGRAVGLDRIVRRRHFELSFALAFGLSQPRLPATPSADWERGYMCTITTRMSCPTHFYPRKRAGLKGTVPNDEAREVMGIGIPMPSAMVGEAVPPPMARYIGEIAAERIGEAPC